MQQIVQGVLILLAVLRSITSHPLQTDSQSDLHHSNRHRHIHISQEPELEVPTELPLLQNMFSPRVSFTRTRPVAPPWQLNTDQRESVQELQQVALGIANETHLGSYEMGRRKRSVPEGDAVPVCRSQSQWVQYTEAYDTWGNLVDVLTEMDIDGVMVHQYIYETRCQAAQTQCTGIDRRRYLSVCQTQHVFAYAKIRDRTGQAGWNLIKIPGSCNCALFRKPEPTMDLLDLIHAASYA